MRRSWLAAGALALTMLAGPGAAAPVDADHCFGVGVEPRRGPVGTVFVIQAGVNDPSWITLFHDGVPVSRHRIVGYSYEVRFATTSADIGSWRAHLRVPSGDQPCQPNATFTVTAAPDTATFGAPPAPILPSTSPGPAILLLATTGLAGGLLGLRRSVGGRSR